eukprot:4896854-Amphidinium_carterae.2
MKFHNHYALKRQDGWHVMPDTQHLAQSGTVFACAPNAPSLNALWSAMEVQACQQLLHVRTWPRLIEEVKAQYVGIPCEGLAAGQQILSMTKF